MASMAVKHELVRVGFVAKGTVYAVIAALVFAFVLFAAWA